jgi:hypothetical protein
MMLNERFTKNETISWVLLRMRSLKRQHAIMRQPLSFPD